MADVFFENTSTRKRYKVLKFNKDEGTVTLIGPQNVEFTDSFTPERFKEMGYELKQGVFEQPGA